MGKAKWVRRTVWAKKGSAPKITRKRKKHHRVSRGEETPFGIGGGDFW